ncbi:hypothetical protein MTER_37560 [Mycolicibacter terrae]|uniref:Transmembrane protein n=1 Tax=Mycolicibacter terrae TaxID=1788 RepID=A0AAD1I0X5_9MYCO|nr:hypothetical protein [Mycolicibacter terrae]ORW93550.1 hypothetical protein AWC28_15800 [Mycolicibacter terrae]BBX24345.1 hypothetical protein MTER_37560 [Mycolicibacter terrae]SNV54191.1 Uncharacterised protein [Mycolicibacter terrae]
MKRTEPLCQPPIDAAARLVYGEPHQTPDGATVITAARIQAAGRDGAAVTATPLGVVVIRGDRAKWVPTVDADRIALVGVITGLVSAVIASLAVLRRPPWPDLRAGGDRRDGAA